jgi:hypothetical protein
MQVLQVRIMDLLQLQDVVLASDRYVDLQKQAFYAKSAELRTHTPPTWVVHPPALRARGIAAWTIVRSVCLARGARGQPDGDQLVPRVREDVQIPQQHPQACQRDQPTA